MVRACMDASSSSATMLVSIGDWTNGVRCADDATGCPAINDGARRRLRLRRARQDGAGAACRRRSRSGPLQTAGPRCQGGTCTCREVDDYGRPTGDSSRNEGEVAPGPQALRDPHRPRLRPHDGDDRRQGHDDQGHRAGGADLRLRRARARALRRARCASRPRIQAQGIQPRLLVNEYGRSQNDWYSTFSFACGGGVGPCIKDDMKDWFDKARAVDRGIFDKCGSTRVEGHPLVGRAFAGADARGSDARLRPARLQVRAALRPRHADVQGHLGRQGRRAREHAGRRARRVSRPPSAVRLPLAAALVVAALVAAPSTARAQAAWLRDRLDVEWVVATGGWRTAIGHDRRARARLRRARRRRRVRARARRRRRPRRRRRRARARRRGRRPAHLLRGARQPRLAAAPGARAAARRSDGGAGSAIVARTRRWSAASSPPASTSSRSAPAAWRRRCRCASISTPTSARTTLLPDASAALALGLGVRY